MSNLSLSRPEELSAAILSLCRLDPTSRCLVWQRGCSTQGKYPVLWVDDQTQFVYRLAYQLWVGDLPQGSLDHSPDSVEVHHTCANHLCCNPIHLVALTRAAHIELHREERFNDYVETVPEVVSLLRTGMKPVRVRVLTGQPLLIIFKVWRVMARLSLLPAAT